MTTINKVRLGKNGPLVFPFALGCMGMGAGSAYGDSDEAESIATIHEAIERGVDILDTGDFYGMGRNELLINKALKDRRDKVLLSVKFGMLRGPDGAFLGCDTRPVAMKTSLTYSLSRLGVDYIDIYRPARLDTNVPIEDTIGAMVDMVKAGYIRYISLSEVGVETIKRAAKVYQISDLQIEYALISRTAEEKIIPTLNELDIAMTAYGVLSRGLLTGIKPFSKNDFRGYLPRFSKGNIEKNELLASAFARIAAEKGLSPVQLAIAWVRAKGVVQNVTILPTIGARTRKQLVDALSGLDISLEMSDIEALETAVPASEVAGTRYPEVHMAMLDSER